MTKLTRFCLMSLIVLGLAGCAHSTYRTHSYAYDGATYNPNQSSAYRGVTPSVTRTSRSNRSYRSVSRTNYNSDYKGNLLSNNLNKDLNSSDQKHIAKALENNKTDKTSSWANKQNKNRFSVTPVLTYVGSQGEPCREYRTVVNINGKKQTVYNKACRNNGVWTQTQ